MGLLGAGQVPGLMSGGPTRERTMSAENMRLMGMDPDFPMMVGPTSALEQQAPASQLPMYGMDYQQAMNAPQAPVPAQAAQPGAAGQTVAPGLYGPFPQGDELQRAMRAAGLNQFVGGWVNPRGILPPDQGGYRMTPEAYMQMRYDDAMNIGGG